MSRLSYIDWWKKINNEGISIGEYLQKREVHSIAIWGLGKIARRLREELLGFDINVKYGVILNDENCLPEVVILDRNDELPMVDLVIVTEDSSYRFIEKEICEHYDYSVISIDLLVREVAYYRESIHFDKIKKFCIDNTCFYLYGAGKVGKLCLEKLKKWELYPQGFVVSKCEENQFFEGIPVISLERFCELGQGGIVVTVGYDLHDEIVQRIENMGIQNYISYI